MPPRRKPDPSEPGPKQFTLEEIEGGIRKLKRRIDEVKGIEANIGYNAPQVEAATRNIHADLIEVFGKNSREYVTHFDLSVGYPEGVGGLHTTEYDLQQRFTRGLPKILLTLESLIKRLEEKREDLGSDTTARVRSAFEGLDLHPRIASVCVDLYRDGHYRNAVADAAVALVNYVKEKSRRHELDGSGLMSTVFSKNKAVLAFNDLSDRTDEDEQEGMMHLFVGAVLALRNPRVHTLLDDSPEMALEYIAFISMLAKRVDQAKRTP
jgi:uncharacterized protein (TIGR02391 family)